MEESEKVYVTQGFIKKFSVLFEDEDASFGDFARLLVFQPYLVAKLLRTANHMCECHGSFKRPTSVQGIINILGFSKVEEEIKRVEYAPLHDEYKVLNQAIECYVLASVYSFLAEERFGKKKAPEHFLAGLIAPLVEQDESILCECNDELRDYFNSSYTHGIQMDEVSTIEQVKELIKGFEKGTKHLEARYLYAVWYESRRSARLTLTTYSDKYVE
ncbi:MAG: hypothetical protein CO060_02875 [Candidatus Yonathbacteria bacterium CG_4_9_14_0_2_um_filter_43_16]|uniref:HDOD domain-containing protein n=2 Tax=Parcubacteria group TaxID=1794811 RepID=A0A2M7Q687_9BACT|nr:MAG: hypothetical protein AUK15_02490 [Candidatus Nomurabacteria bacterium CG2_30_43_9]PIQ36003.1 MAG: hypothetical protein COW60_01000 [Candidatus Yonathbacteria bacterium CG17_big_fil_post_rev_8_21_14_2_50_43_9]PIX57102.1 MAG: hypothetical protein COZ48_02535 [Candidatus Yonathbacteria bacterium CG_4_10_14_3_um_filter_43_12]PIY58474.1 MAG: hypothetical protein COY98_01950 [Candidatus Yonathbacteria bacterium CG_4_10_14_0_8_um_filter_43_17]PJC21648.1 MAG: hypothetical protein CO060_02875 [C